MIFNEESDLLPKKGTKHGRRASKGSSPGSPEEIKEFTNGKKSPPEVPIRTRKTGGWADEGSKSAKSKGGTNLIEQERFQGDNVQDNTGDDIPIIPDMDDLQDDPLNLPDVKFPNVTVKESTYKELDSQFDSGAVNFGNLGDVDLTILTTQLYPEKDVQKCTGVWTLESLYHDLSKQ